jgi:hypothetical protein
MNGKEAQAGTSEVGVGPIVGLNEDDIGSLLGVERGRRKQTNRQPDRPGDHGIQRLFTTPRALPPAACWKDCRW